MKLRKPIQRSRPLRQRPNTRWPSSLPQPRRRSARPLPRRW
nr:MAG TPA: hypothetical protein [Caudoviricetes sp.]